MVKRVTLYHFANFMMTGRAVAGIWRFIIFLQNGDHPTSCVHLTHIGTTHEEYLVVFIVMQNLVGINKQL